ncbi:hypothetical protein CCM_09480 [Cordyceps militaris CM01]|uniref:HNH nuclease domain-containing protein n=1 Tax=Cordyceps militaris (strain CM01) TaxID=983644 RepID=G3JUQ7_CORMM|nr:uncharacterized protein CCM_09480 [Cordyceps militaris CM01]EGX87857.1 hypothetical protein CCM_09480 [Cordyceps militaris CM01]
MSNAAVTPEMRPNGWNVQLLFGDSNVPADGLFKGAKVSFAGVFQAAKNTSLTFRDVVDELRLSFEFPHESSELWGQVAFGLAAMLNVTEDECPAPTFIHGDGLRQTVPALPTQRPRAPNDRAILQYLVFRHGACNVTADKPLKSHFEEGCAQHISKPERRLDPRYLPPKRPSKNPHYLNYPLRKTIRARKPSPTKRSASGSVSLSMDQDLDQVDEDSENIIAPVDCNIDAVLARSTMNKFRNVCLHDAEQCVVTGMGGGWCTTPSVGPGLQACHIVSQLHYHTYMPYPPRSNASESQGYNAGQLRDAWERTWSQQNSIPLLSHLHEMFDQRLFSIHPDTLRIRAFMPYDVVVAYHGRTANISPMVDRDALRHHYDMCCIENMAAKISFQEPGTTAATSGVSTPLELRTVRLGGAADPRILDSPSEQNEDQDGASGGGGGGGDPSKRARRTGRQANDSYITPDNSEWFLESVNWSLIR